MERTVTCASAGAAMARVVAARAMAARLALTSFMSSPPESFFGGICARLLSVRKRGPALQRQALEQRLEGLFDALEGDAADFVDHGVSVHEGAHGGRDGLAVFVDGKE